MFVAAVAIVSKPQGETEAQDDEWWEKPPEESTPEAETAMVKPQCWATGSSLSPVLLVCCLSYPSLGKFEKVLFYSVRDLFVPPIPSLALS